jgi:hypothetical protein
LTYTDSQVCEFQHQFAQRRKRQLFATIPVVGAVLLVIAADRLRTPVLGISPSVMAPFAFAVVVGMVVFTLVNWRCPACNSYLGKRLNPSFCSSCGVQLRESPNSTESRLRS